MRRDVNILTMEFDNAGLSACVCEGVREDLRGFSA